MSNKLGLLLRNSDKVLRGPGRAGTLRLVVLIVVWFTGTKNALKCNNNVRTYTEIKHHRAKGHEGKPCPAAKQVWASHI